MYISFIIFTRLYNEAKDYEDVDYYIAERGWQEWMENFDPDTIVKILNEIYGMAKEGVKKPQKQLGICRSELAMRFQIPLRTLENWANEVTRPSEFVETMLEYIIYLERNVK